MNVFFENAWILLMTWLVPALAAAWWWQFRRRERRLAELVAPALQPRLCPPGTLARRAWQTGLLATGLICLLVALARPRWGTREEIQFQQGRNIVIALDVSRSMLATDVHPNRLTRAKADIYDLIRELKGDRAALVTFRRKANVLCPLTWDYAFLVQALDAADPASAPPGETDISDAITKSLEALEQAASENSTILLISDGEDLGGQAIEAARLAAQRGVTIFTVGIGSRRGSNIPSSDSGSDGFVRFRNETVISRLDDETLNAIARETGGAYVPVGTAGVSGTTLGTLYREHLRRITAREAEERIVRRHRERFAWFLLPGLILIMAAGSLSRGHLSSRRIPSPPPVPPALKAVMLLLIVWPGVVPAHADVPPEPDATTTSRPPAQVSHPSRQGYDAAREAQRLFARGEYESAANAFLQAASGVPNPTAGDFRYNAALARLKAGHYRAAADILRPLAFLPERRADWEQARALALYQVATQSASNAVERAEAWRQAGEAFKEALRLEPDQADTRHDLDWIFRKLPEHEEQAAIEQAMARYGNLPPGTIAESMLAEQRAITRGIEATRTNNTPDRIGILESLAAQQRTNADRWIPLKGKLLEAMQGQTNAAQQAAAVAQAAELTRDDMRTTADRLDDLDLNALEASRRLDQNVYTFFWKPIAGHPSLLNEAIRRQSNAVIHIPTNQAVTLPPETIPEQQETLDLTRLFKQRFEQEVPETPPPATGETSTGQSDTNALSPETRLQILELSDSAAKAQQRALESLKEQDWQRANRQQQDSHDFLDEISKLLPKQQSKDSSEPSESPTDAAQQPDPEQPQKPEPDQPKPDQPSPAEPQSPDDEKQPEESDKPEDSEPPLPEDVRRMLDRALQRERDHEAERKRRESNIPMAPSERDW